MSREYRDLLVKGAPDGEGLEEKARGGRGGRGLLPNSMGRMLMRRSLNKRSKLASGPTGNDAFRTRVATGARVRRAAGYLLRRKYRA